MLLPADPGDGAAQRAGDERPLGRGVTGESKKTKWLYFFFFSPFLSVFVFRPAEIQKRVQHQPGLDGNLQIRQAIQEPGEVASRLHLKGR